MARGRTARQLEAAAAAAGPPRRRPPAAPPGEALAMLVRRGLRPRRSRPDVPFDPDLAETTADRLADLLGHYAFRLFLRGAILRREGFAPQEATPYVAPAAAETFARSLVDLGLAEALPRGRFRLAIAASNFGGTLEWYVGRELSRRLAFDVATGVRFHARGVGGDLDVVAAAEGKLVYLELKSSPPKHLSPGEIAAFADRLQLVRPDLALFVMDTALRLSDKVLPMLVEGLAARLGEPHRAPRRLHGEVWALSPYVYALNGRPDLMRNIARALAAGLRALAPDPVAMEGSRDR
jgi:hypothetical protein